MFPLDAKMTPFLYLYARVHLYYMKFFCNFVSKKNMAFVLQYNEKRVTLQTDFTSNALNFYSTHTSNN